MKNPNNIFSTAKPTNSQERSRNMCSKKGNSIERSGVAQVRSRQLDIEVPKSEIIIGGVELYKD